MLRKPPTSLFGTERKCAFLDGMTFGSGGVGTPFSAQGQPGMTLATLPAAAIGEVAAKKLTMRLVQGIAAAIGYGVL